MCMHAARIQRERKNHDLLGSRPNIWVSDPAPSPKL